MAYIELTLPDSLLRKAQAFEPEALAELRNICLSLNLSADISDIVQRGMTAFLYGKRNEDKTEIDKIADLLSTNGKIVADIQNSGKYYIIELFRHYCDVAMRWDLLGVLFPQETSTGRIFYRDYCAVAIQYLNATKAELMAIDTGNIQFEKQPYHFKSYKIADLKSLIVECDGVEPVAVQTGLFANLSKEEYLKGAYDKVKEWRKCIALGRPDTELSKASGSIVIWRSVLGTFSHAPEMKDIDGNKTTIFTDAIKAYNRDNPFPVSDEYIYKTFLQISTCVLKGDLIPVAENSSYYEFKGTIGEFYRKIYMTKETPSDSQINNFVASLRFLSQQRVVINGVATQRRGKKYIQVPAKVDIRFIDFPVLPAHSDEMRLNAKGEQVRCRTSAATEIRMFVNKMAAYGVNGMRPVIPDGNNAVMKDSRCILPKGIFNTKHNTAVWGRFVGVIEGASHKAEADLMDVVFDYQGQIKSIHNDENLTDEDKGKKIRRIQKDKPRDREYLAVFFNEAKKMGIIDNYYKRTMKKDGKAEYVWKDKQHQD